MISFNYIRLIENQQSSVFRSSHWMCFVKKMFLKISQNSIRKHPCWSLFLIKKETTQVLLFCEFCEFFKNTYFAEHLLTIFSEFPHYSLTHHSWRLAFPSKRNQTNQKFFFGTDNSQSFSFLICFIYQINMYSEKWAGQLL